MVGGTKTSGWSVVQKLPAGHQAECISNPPHIDYLDGLRSIALLAAITIHSSAWGVVRYGEIDIDNWWWANIFDSLSRWAVPVFIMISGALILDQQRTYTTWNFYRKRLIRIGVPLIFWAAFYFCWTDKYYGEEVDIQFILDSLKNGLAYNHLYFLFIILGLYVVTPFFRFLISVLPSWTIGALTVLVFYLTSSGALYKYLSTNALTIFIPYIGYYFLGYLLQLLRFSDKWLIPVTLIYLGFSLLIIVGTGSLVEQYGVGDYRALRLYDHFHPYVILQTMSIYLALRIIFSFPRRKISVELWRFLAPMTFGIYLSHVMILDVLRTFTSSFYMEMSAITIVLEVCVTYAFSAFLSYVILRIAYIRHILG